MIRKYCMRYFNGLLPFFTLVSLLLLMLPTLGFSITYKDINVEHEKNVGNSTNKKHRSNVVYKNNNTNIINININKENNRCETPSGKSTFLSFGKYHNLIINNNIDDYWYCVNNVFDGFDIGVRSQKLFSEKSFQIKIKLYDEKFNLIESLSSSTCWECGEEYHNLAHYGGQRKELPKGRYFLQLVKKGEVSGELELYLNQSNGRSYSGPFK